jgi:hypothetical protein
MKPGVAWLLIPRVKYSPPQDGAFQPCLPGLLDSAAIPSVVSDRLPDKLALNALVAAGVAVVTAAG